MNNENYIKTEKALRGIIYNHFSINNSGNSSFFFDVIFKHYDPNEFIKTFPETLGQDFYSIVWYHKGSGKHVVDGKEYAIKDNTLFFLSPYNLHFFRDIEDEEIVTCIVFSKESLINVDKNIRDKVYSNVYSSGQGITYLEIDDSIGNILQSITAEIKRELSAPEKKCMHNEYMAFLLSLFLINLLRSKRENQKGNIESSNSIDYFNSFYNLVEKNFAQHHSVQYYAERLCISNSSLYKIVKQYSQSTPSEIIDNRVAAEAKRLLTSTDLSNKEVAEVLNFKDDSHFNKFFKRITGCSPKDFRRNSH